MLTYKSASKCFFFSCFCFLFYIIWFCEFFFLSFSTFLFFFGSKDYNGQASITLNRREMQFIMLLFKLFTSLFIICLQFFSLHLFFIMSFFWNKKFTRLMCVYVCVCVNERASLRERLHFRKNLSGHRMKHCNAIISVSREHNVSSTYVYDRGSMLSSCGCNSFFFGFIIYIYPNHVIFAQKLFFSSFARSSRFTTFYCVCEWTV